MIENGQLTQSNQSLTTRGGAIPGKGELPTPGTRRSGVQSGSPPTTINNNNIVININKNYNATTGNMRKQLKQVREEIFDEEDTTNRPHPAVEEEEEEEGNDDEVERKSAVQARAGKQSRMSKKSTGHNLNQPTTGAAPYEMTPLRKDQVMVKKWN